ncbi:MAG: hypothetical protein ACFB11_00870 [Paracoccaceae bacterium]
MRAQVQAITNRLNARDGLYNQLLVWMEARNRVTDAIETVGFWTGAEDREFSVGGQTRLYHGAGAIIGIPPMIAQKGLQVRTHRMTASPLDEEVIKAIRLYDLRLRPVEMHVAYFSLIPGALIAAPQRVFKGRVSAVRIIRPELDGEASCEIAMQSAAYKLSRPLSITKSDSSHQARHPGDKIMQYADVTGVVEVAWGEARATAPTPTAPPKAQPTGTRRVAEGR